MSDGITIEFDKRDVDALFRQIEAAQKYLNYDIGRAIGLAVRSLLSTLGTSTGIAPKERKIRELKDVAAGPQAVHRYSIEGYFGKPRRHGVKVVRSRTLEIARRRYAQIRNRGLAKLTWRAAGKSLKLSIMDAIGAAASDVSQRAARYVSTESRLEGFDSYVCIRNRLEYIEQAVAVGRQSLDTAMSRAADMMEHSIDNALVKRMGLGSMA